MRPKPFPRWEIRALRALPVSGPLPCRPGVLVLLLLTFALPAPGVAQDGDWSVLRKGDLRVGVLGDFIWGDERYGVNGDVLPLAGPFEVENAATLFPEFEKLGQRLFDITGDGSAAPVLGSSQATLQTSQTRVPLTLELGLTSWLTLGATVPFHRSRVEAEIGILPSALANVGTNPAISNYDAVLAFTRELTEAAAGLPAEQSTIWTSWAANWVDAYAASAVFPATGTVGGEALLEAVAEFNAVLSAAGLPTVGTAVPLADAPLDRDDLRALLSDPQGPYQYYPPSIPLLWGLGDVEVEARLRVLQGGPRRETGRPSHGLTLMGRVRLPTGSGEDPRGIYDIPRGDGQLDLEAGAAGWFRFGRFGLAGSGSYTLARTGTVLRRIAPPDIPLVPLANLAEVEWTPGNLLTLELRPSFAVADPLWLEVDYRYRSKGDDQYERTTPLPEAGPPIPYPEGQLGLPAEVLEVESSMELHTLGGGLRYQPPQGEFPVEVWAGVAFSVMGSGGQTLKETRARFGGRVYFSLWGG
jgi:hypothetical protein